jgi:hypothetical protein
MEHCRRSFSSVSHVSVVWLPWVAVVLFSFQAERAPCGEPLFSTIRGDENIVFYPTAAWQDESRTEWIVPIHGCVYEFEARELAVAAVKETLEWGGTSLTEEQQVTLRERLRFMTVDNHRGRTVVISLGTESFTLGKSGPDGHFRRDIRLSDAQVARIVEMPNSRRGELGFSAVMGAGDTRVFRGSVVCIPPTGVTVISDIDDTIKRTQVRDLRAMLRASFLEPFVPVSGMAHLYQDWHRQNEAQIWYVSATPWQLYDPLSRFLSAETFPQGPITLRKVRFKDKSLAELIRAPENYKRKTISEILSRFPMRRFVLVGDSGEKDPEVYGDLARRCPKQVAGVLIRDVTGEAEGSARYSAAFRGVPSHIWRVFKRPEEALDFPTPSVR